MEIRFTLHHRLIINCFFSFCSVDEDRPLAKFGPRVVAALAPFMGSATEDSLGVVLEALSTVIQVDTGRWLTPELATTVVGMMLASYEKNINGIALISFFV